ncbi:DUF397 domain-containing protein [Streptomyces albidoflavus]|uniref:DUF397 domain-containing protein n=1 Tax=Streptomyces TaxID=1883 RepID=UPI00159ED7BB|nr:DUF397 domain-containing protein [Streptomyces sp. JV186]MEE1722013.1 DUF397 domain-containing protein [Streptomyces sp. JV186]QLA56829.1 DUF397 domain-containing protein [Streptomyces violascens]
MTTESPRWFKSSYSENGGACVEVATNLVASNGLVPVRDSKDLAGPVLALPVSAFSSFIAGVKVGNLGSV